MSENPVEHGDALGTSGASTAQVTAKATEQATAQVIAQATEQATAQAVAQLTAQATGQMVVQAAAPSAVQATAQVMAGGSVRRVRADAQRNIDALRESAKAVFADSGVDAPVREIAARAGVGVGTIYRHFPLRSDLVVAVFRHEVDACADAALALAAEHEPGEALAGWLRRYTRFVATKRGLAAALHSGDPAFDALPGYFDQHLRPALGSLLASAAAAGVVRAGVEPKELLHAVAYLCLADDDGATLRMVDLLIDGLRYGGTVTAAHDTTSRPVD